MNIKEIFLQLTSRTFPHGTEQEVFHLLGDGLQEDEFGNLFIKIGESDVMFTSHLDTATSALTTVTHVFEGNIIKTDGKSILGADDKAGVTVMLHMIENKIPGLYYFFLGEEVGCIGSKKVASKQKEEKIEGINKVISFDRRGNDSIITYQSGQRCASDTFGSALAKAFNDVDDTFKYKIDPTGVLTDSVQFIKIYSECTNISVGYKSEHTFSESQDIEHLEKLADACLKIDWNALPVERDPSVTEYKSYGSYGGYGSSYSDDWDEDYYYGTSRWRGGWGPSTKPTAPKTELIWFYDKKHDYVSKIEIETVSKKYIDVDLCEERINFEKEIIHSLLVALEIDFTEFTWDGLNLVAYDEEGATSKVDRNEFIQYLPELDYKEMDEFDSEYELY